MPVLAVLLAVSLFVLAVPPATPAAPADLSRLPIAFPIQSAEVAAYFNQIARPEDTASFPAAFVSLLPEVKAGRKSVSYASWAQAERELDMPPAGLSQVAYNAEHWENTPAAEQQDLVATVRRAAAQAHARGWEFMFAPDRRFAEECLAQAAPYVDAVTLQGQRLQDDPQAFASWITGMIAVARATHPGVRIYVQVGATRGPAAEMLAALQTVAGQIDGIGVWSMPSSLTVLQELVALLRPPEAASSALPSLTTSSASPAVPSAFPGEPQGTVTSPASTTTAEARASVGVESESWWLYLAMGGGAAALVVLLAVWVRRRRGR